MNAVNSIFVSLMFLIGSGYAVDKLYIAVKRAAVTQIHKSLPPLTALTNRLTCSKISKTGELVPIKCRKTR